MLCHAGFTCLIWTWWECPGLRRRLRKHKGEKRSKPREGGFGKLLCELVMWSCHLIMVSASFSTDSRKQGGIWLWQAEPGSATRPSSSLPVCPIVANGCWSRSAVRTRNWDRRYPYFPQKLEKEGGPCQCVAIAGLEGKPRLGSSPWTCDTSCGLERQTMRCPRGTVLQVFYK